MTFWWPTNSRATEVTAHVMPRPRIALALSLLMLAACSESETASTPDACTGSACTDATLGDANTDGTTNDGTTNTDGSTDGSTASDGSSGDGATADGASNLDASTDGGLDASLDASTDGALVDTAPIDTAPVDTGPPPCPIYQTRCDGVCIPTSVDPANCGACGMRCATGEVCNGGVCGTTCPSGLTACGGRCVNVQSDNANCGACASACPSGQGCVAGRCERLMVLDTSAVTCAGGVGPLVDLGEGRCAGTVAETTFRWALCACRNVGLSAPLRTDGFDSTRGPYAPGGTGAGVGANGTFSSSNVTQIGGALWIGNAGPWGISSPHTVSQVLRVNGDFTGSSALTVRDDAYVNGAVRTSATINVSGAIHMPEGAGTLGDITTTRFVREPVTVTPPCDCNAAARVPMERWIAEARTRNDNARLGLSASALMGINTAQRLDLPCGRFYLRGIASSAPVTIVAHGRVVLFIDGDISQSQALTITLDPTAELDVVLGGRLGISAPLTIGSTAYPALTRLYVASPDGLSLTNSTTLGCNVYVPDGRFGTSGALEVFGALFVGELSASNNLTVHYDRAVLRVGDACRSDTPTTPVDGGVSTDAGRTDGSTTTDGGSTSDAGRTDGGTTPMCTSCRDCANQACNGGTCGACRADSDCCAPLQCWMGRCVVIPG